MAHSLHQGPGPSLGSRSEIGGVALEPNEASLQRFTAAPSVGGGAGAPSGVARTVYPYDASASSAHINPYTGIMDFGTLTKMRERAVYDLNTLSYAPVADSNTGVIFPDSVRAKTEAETSLRARPTSFKGPQQLDVADEDGDVHLNRQLHPNGTNVAGGQAWYREQEAGAAGSSRGNNAFVGYPNPDLFYAYMDAISTHNLQNLSHAEMADVIRQSGGGYDHDDDLRHVGSIMQATSHDGARHPSAKVAIESDGAGLGADPRILERMQVDYELAFQKARRLQVADASFDPRFAANSPASAYIAEQHDFEEAQETQFSAVSKLTGVGSSYSHPQKLRTG